MAASSIYERNGLVQFGFTNSHPDFTKGGNYMFSTAPNQTEMPRSWPASRSRISARRSSCCSTRTRTGARPRPTSSRGRRRSLGAQIVYRDAYLPDEKDFKTIVTKARDANPDGLALMSYYTDAALIAQQARAQGLNVDIIANGASYSPKFMELGGPAVEGASTTSTWFSGNPRPGVQAFVKKYKEKYNNEEPNSFAANAYDAIMVLANVIDKVGTDRKAIRDGMASLKDSPSIVLATIASARSAGPTSRSSRASRLRAASSSSGSSSQTHHVIPSAASLRAESRDLGGFVSNLHPRDARDDRGVQVTAGHSSMNRHERVAAAVAGRSGRLGYRSAPGAASSTASSAAQAWHA